MNLSSDSEEQISELQDLDIPMRAGNSFKDQLIESNNLFIYLKLTVHTLSNSMELYLLRVLSGF
jgi:hypothetical protein